MPSLSTPDQNKIRHMRSNQAAAAKNSEREVFISRLKSVVEAFGSNSAFAREIGSAESTIRRWLAGTVEPKYDSLVAIANVANVSLEWLMTGKEDADSPIKPIYSSESTIIHAEQSTQKTMIVGWDNMEPTIYKGDEIGIEAVKIDPREVTSGIYVLKMGDSRGVWRIQPAADQKIWLLNDNPKYQKGDTAIEITQAHNVEIDARVLWVRHNF
jgi:phage repressor protein C with HTH and peptisase S24 domain